MSSVFRVPAHSILANGDEHYAADAANNDCVAVSLPDKRSQSDAEWTANLMHELMTGSIPKGLDFEIFLLKRKEDMFALHKTFSANKSESESLVLQRISEARKKARSIAAYTCISEYLFAEPRIDRHFLYDQVIAEGQSGGHHADVGCCVGTDIRKMIHDGIPAQNITGIDCQPKFFGVGLQMYNQTHEDLKVQLVDADVLAPNFFDRYQHLEGKFDFVHSANVIHLFNREQQVRFISALAFLVKPGGLVWGRQVGERDDSPTKGKIIDGKGERFTPAEFMGMWVEATGWTAASLDYCSRLVAYDELRHIPDYKKLSLEWTVRAGADRSEIRSTVEESA